MADGPMIVPIQRRRMPVVVPQPIHEYQVLMNVEQVSGARVDAKRHVVRLTPGQAQYWLDQGVLKENK